MDESAGGRVPDVHALVEGARGDVLPVRGERHGVDGLLQKRQLFSGKILDTA